MAFWSRFTLCNDSAMKEEPERARVGPVDACTLTTLAGQIVSAFGGDRHG